MLGQLLESELKCGIHFGCPCPSGLRQRGFQPAVPLSDLATFVKYRKIPSRPHRPPPQIRKPCNACYGCQANYQEFGLVETLHHAVPFFSQKVT